MLKTRIRVRRASIVTMSAAMMATTASILALAVVPASAQPAVDDYVRAASL
ncbi:MAG: hypothetical protein IT178_16135, partial [Acidobacteria bacterium]|nr:hypothetical protein [Acidobacteriota bacterium]